VVRGYQLAADGVEIIMSGLTWQLQKQYPHPALSLCKNISQKIVWCEYSENCLWDNTLKTERCKSK